MVEGAVTSEAWVWAVRHRPDGVREDLWHRPGASPGGGVLAIRASASPPPRRQAAGSRRAVETAPSPPPPRRRSGSRAPPPPADGDTQRAPARVRAPGRSRDEVRSPSEGAASCPGSSGRSASTYSASVSPSGTRWSARAPPEEVRSAGSHGSGSGRAPRRGVYASGLGHHHLPAPDRRTPQTPRRRRRRSGSPAQRSRSPISRNRSVVLTAPPDEPRWETSRGPVWVPDATALPSLPAAASGRSRTGTRPKPSGAPRRTVPPRRRSHTGRRRRSNADTA